MYHMLYLSTARNLFSDEQLENILTVSRHNNESSAITGVLLYHDGGILQVLEGEQEKVDHLFEKISADHRHYGTLKVLEHSSDERYFDNWSMGFRRLSDKEWNDVEGYLPLSAMHAVIDTQDRKTDQILRFIQSFCRSNF